MEEKLKVEEAAFLALVYTFVGTQKKHDEGWEEWHLLNKKIKKVEMKNHDLKRQMVKECEKVSQFAFSPECEHFEFIIEEVWLSKEKDPLYYYYCSSAQGKKWIFEEMVELYSGVDDAIALTTHEEEERIKAFVLERRKAL